MGQEETEAMSAVINEAVPEQSVTARTGRVPPCCTLST